MTVDCNTKLTIASVCDAVRSEKLCQYAAIDSPSDSCFLPRFPVGICNSFITHFYTSLFLSLSRSRTVLTDLFIPVFFCSPLSPWGTTRPSDGWKVGGGERAEFWRPGSSVVPVSEKLFLFSVSPLRGPTVALLCLVLSRSVFLCFSFYFPPWFSPRVFISLFLSFSGSSFLLPALHYLTASSLSVPHCFPFPNFRPPTSFLSYPFYISFCFPFLFYNLTVSRKKYTLQDCRSIRKLNCNKHILGCTESLSLLSIYEVGKV